MTTGIQRFFIVHLGLRNVGSGLAKEICVRLGDMNIELDYFELLHARFWQSRQPVEPGYPEVVEPVWFNRSTYVILPELVCAFTEISFKLFSIPDRFLSFEFEIICDRDKKGDRYI